MLWSCVTYVTVAFGAVSLRFQQVFGFHPLSSLSSCGRKLESQLSPDPLERSGHELSSKALVASKFHVNFGTDKYISKVRRIADAEKELFLRRSPQYTKESCNLPNVASYVVLCSYILLWWSYTVKFWHWNNSDVITFPPLLVNFDPWRKTCLWNRLAQNAPSKSPSAFFNTGTQILPHQVYERDPIWSCFDNLWPGIIVKRYWIDRKIISYLKELTSPTSVLVWFCTPLEEKCSVF